MAVCGDPTSEHPDQTDENHGANELKDPKLKVILNKEQLENALKNGLSITVNYRRTATWYKVDVYKRQHQGRGYCNSGYYRKRIGRYSGYFEKQQTGCGKMNGSMIFYIIGWLLIFEAAFMVLPCGCLLYTSRCV